MKSRILMCITAMTLFAALALPTPCPAQEYMKKLPHYTVIDLGTLRGTYSNAYGINNSGWLSGISTLPGDTEIRAFLWRNGVMIDLGTFGGQNSATYFSPNDRGDLGGGRRDFHARPVGGRFLRLWYPPYMSPVRLA